MTTDNSTLSSSIEPRCWHLPGPLPPSCPLPEAPSQWCRFSNSNEEEEEREDEDDDDDVTVVDVAARVSDGAGGDFWLQASGVVLKWEEP